MRSSENAGRSDLALVFFLVSMAVGVSSGLAVETEVVFSETAGWHIMRPGESLEKVSAAYLDGEDTWRTLIDWNPALSRPSAVAVGDRVRVRLKRGLPDGGSLVSRLSGQVLTYPSPVDWTRGRIFDLLLRGDGIRTLGSASAQLTFGDASRLIVGEQSLLFLGEQDFAMASPTRDRRADIEIVAGHVDFEGERLPTSDDFEILVGRALVKTVGNEGGVLRTRAKQERGGPGQLMMFRGQGRVSRGGASVEVVEGSGVVLPRNGPIPKPEPLLEPPALLAPEAGARVPLDRLSLLWGEVPGAETYSVELCRDRQCGSLILRRTGLIGRKLRLESVSSGDYFWRVTGSSATGIDGYPSTSWPVRLTLPRLPERPGGPAVLKGSVRDHLTGVGLPGVTIQVLELDLTAASKSDGSFRFDDIPTGEYTLDAELDGFLPVRVERLAVAPGRETEIDLSVEGLPTAYAEVVVTPSQVSLGEESPTLPVALSRDDIVALPHLADDIFRALPLLPGATANDISAEFHVRGGRRDEVDVRLDGQELYEAYHLRDFGGALSVIAPSSLGSVDLRTGGYPVQFGDRMSAVLDMRSAVPVARHALEVGLGVLTSKVGSRGTLAGDRGSWMAIGRSGSTELSQEFLSGPGPEFWDLFVKGDYRVGGTQRITLRGLSTSDRLTFEETIEEELKEHRTEHENLYLWGTHQSILSRQLFVDSTASWSLVKKDRYALEIEEEQEFEFLDRRELEVSELRQEWNAQWHAQHLFAFGAGMRHYGVSYDDLVSLDHLSPVARLRTYRPEESLTFVESYSSDHVSVYLSDQWRPRSHLTFEIGTRYDHHSLTQEAFFSPRFNVAWVLAPATILRASWGVFHQSHRPHELAVTDGAVGFSHAERSEQSVLGLEHTFRGRDGSRRVSFRVEAYDRRIENPRARYENLFEAFNNFPELEPDRVLIAPLESRARGLEINLRGATRGGLDAWANYAWSSTEDRLSAGWKPRAIDQTHAVNVGLSVPLRRWRAVFAWRYHTGWPTTPVRFALTEDEDGEPDWDPRIGRRNSLRLSDYHRLDLRLSRRFAFEGGGALEFFVDIQNVYDRSNLAGFDFEFDEDLGTARQVSEFWPGIVPSIGINWTF